MRLENLNKLINANATLINVLTLKNQGLMKLRNRIVDKDFVPTQNQINTAIGKIKMLDAQQAFDKSKSIFTNPNIIIDPVDPE